MHPRVSLHQVAFLDRTTEEFLDHCRKIGVSYATLVADMAAQLAEPPAGIAIAALNRAFAVHPDIERDSGEAAARLNETIELAERLCANSVYLVTGGRGALDWEAAAARFAELVAPCRERAERAGIELLVENASPFNADIHMAHTLSDTLRLAEIADIGVCIELHACWAEAGLSELFRRAMPRCGLVQVSDYVLGDRVAPCRAVPGDGAIPLEHLLGDLLDAGYAGVFDIELVGPRIAEEGPEAATERAAEHVSALLERLGA